MGYDAVDRSLSGQDNDCDIFYMEILIFWSLE
jgi:hypothetical protein